MNMNFTDAQKATIRGWIESGLKLSDIQNRIAAELGQNLTYMDVRLLVADLQVMPKDPEPAPAPAAAPGNPSGQASSAPAQPSAADPGDAELMDEEMPPQPPPGAGQVTVTTDKITVPGAVASGQVTFSDGQTAQWYLDQYGRLGLAPKTKNYRPPPQDVQAFQMQLQRELEKLGY